MASQERKQRLRDDIVCLLVDLNFAIEDARAHGIPWKLQTSDDGAYVYLNASEDQAFAFPRALKDSLAAPTGETK